MILQVILIVYILKEYFIELINAYKKIFNDVFIIIKDFLHADDLKRLIYFIKNEYYEDLKRYLMTERFQNKIKLCLLNRYENQDAFLYEVVDYMYILNGSSVNSWHRDYTSAIGRIFKIVKHF